MFSIINGLRDRIGKHTFSTIQSILKMGVKNALHVHIELHCLW